MSAVKLFDQLQRKYPSAQVLCVKVEVLSKSGKQIGTTNKISIKAPGQYHTIYAD